jgi:hypothetical protein
MRKTILLLYLPYNSFSKGTGNTRSFQHAGIYEFLDELANQGFISINSAISPIRKVYILKLVELKKSRRTYATSKKDLFFYFKQYSIFADSSCNPYTESKKGI